MEIGSLGTSRRVNGQGGDSEMVTGHEVTEAY